MKNSIDYLKSLNELVRKIWPDVPVWDKDYDYIRDEDRPCFVMEFDDQSEGYLTQDYRMQSMTVSLFYFAPKRHKGYAELLKHKAALSDALLQPVKVDEGFVIYTTDIDYEIDRDDMVLTAMFDIQTVQDYAAERDEALEVMEELILEGDGIDGTWDAEY